MEKCSGWTRPFWELPGPGVPVGFIQTGRVQGGPAERVACSDLIYTIYLFLVGSWASGKLHVFVLD